MKVIAVNGSPRTNSNTGYALSLVAEELEKQGIEVETIQIGAEAIQGCTSCGACSRDEGHCVFASEKEQAWITAIHQADGVLLGSPVYYAGVNGTLKSFLDKAFYCAKGRMRHKVGAAVVVPRRAGGLSAFDDINRYFTISEMFIPGSCYWNMVYGQKPGEAEQDEEGVFTMRTLGKNMGWLLRAIEHSKGELPLPPAEKKTSMNFIR